MLLRAAAVFVVVLILPGCGAEAPADPPGDGGDAVAAADGGPTADGGGIPVLDAGVVPEYLPGQDVIVSYQLADLSPTSAGIVAAIVDAGARVYLIVPDDPADAARAQALATLAEVLGDRMAWVVLVPHQMPGATAEDPTVWARDWAPLSAVTASGARQLLDFGYAPSRPIDDAVPATLAAQLGLERVAVPLRFEGGNFMGTEDGRCFTTQQVLYENDGLTEAQLQATFRDLLGCRTTTIFPTGIDDTHHIDIWAKLVSKDTVLVNEIRAATLERVAPDQGLATEVAFVKQYLDARAADLAALGLTVVRLPMPAPFFKYGITIVPTYSNALLVNTTAIIPSFQASGFSFMDEDLYPTYEADAAAIYRAAGFTPVFVEAGELAKGHGSIHCATMQLAL
ncbi:MAG TPA: agmatine deiminase family protein [Polyangia bacterium]|jgi:agmatine/peptidylarginine deiminase